MMPCRKAPALNTALSHVEHCVLAYDTLCICEEHRSYLKYIVEAQNEMSVALPFIPFTTPNSRCLHLIVPLFLSREILLFYSQNFSLLSTEPVGLDLPI